MWVIAKYNKNKVNLFIDSLKKELNNEDIVIYNPVIKFENYCKKKVVEKKINILDDYMFCFSKEFADSSILNNLKYTKGLKYFLNGVQESQIEIEDFIRKCRNSEDENGFISSNFFEIELNKKYKFKNGLLLNSIFQVLEIQKQRLKILMGGKILSVKKGFFFSHI